MIGNLLLNRYLSYKKKGSVPFLSFTLSFFLLASYVQAESYLDNTLESQPPQQSQGTAAIYLSPTMEAELQSYLNGRLHPPFSQHYDKVNKILTRIEEGIQSSQNDPKWWYYKGLAHRALAYIRFQELKGDNSRFSDEKRKRQLAEQMQSQMRVLELDNEDMPILSLKEYDTLASGMNDEAKIGVYRRMLKYPRDGQENQMILDRVKQQYAATLEQLGRYDEAIAAHENMKNATDDGVGVITDNDNAIARLEAAKALKNNVPSNQDNINDRAKNPQLEKINQQGELPQFLERETQSLSHPSEEEKGGTSDENSIPLMWYVVAVLIVVLLVALGLLYYFVAAIRHLWQRKKKAY